MREGDYVRAYGVTIESLGVDHRSPEGAVGIISKMHPSHWWEVTFGTIRQLVYKENIHPLSDLEVINLFGRSEK